MLEKIIRLWTQSKQYLKKFKLSFRYNYFKKLQNQGQVSEQKLSCTISI